MFALWARFWTVSTVMLESSRASRCHHCFSFYFDVADELNVKVDASSFDDSIVNEFQKFILLFADDTLLFANTVAELQLLLNKLKVYCKKWNITVNINKTKAMLFKCSNRPEQFELFYDGLIIEAVRNFIYLGVNVSCNGKFFNAQKHLSEQASKALFALSNVFNNNTLFVQDKLKTHIPVYSTSLD